ncbi:DNA-dependent ATPase mgs1 [Rhodotorula sphaerocarpa]
MSTLVECPVCGRLVTPHVVSMHLDFGCSASTVATTSATRAQSSSNSAPTSATPSTKQRSANAKRDRDHDEAAEEKPTMRSTPAGTNSTQPSSATSKRSRTGDASHLSGSRIGPSGPRPRTSDTTRSFLEAAKPLPELVRPRVLEDFVGQEHLLGPGALLRGLIEADRIGSVIFWGPPGTGKTTIARVIAKTTSSIFKELSATNATTAQLREVFVEAENVLKLTGRKTLLFIDEIQRFNKSVQDAFLPVVEAGTLSLIASTTENPSFRVNNALLSRCRVFVLNKLTQDDIVRVLVRALRLQHEQQTGEALPPAPAPVPVNIAPEGSEVKQDPDSDANARSPPDVDPVFAHTGPVDPDLVRFLAAAADGDARVALSSLDLALSATRDTGGRVSREELKRSLRKAHLQYDRTGDHHYDTISALHKAVRGSDANAALYWLARMLEGGDDPLFVARRLVRMCILAQVVVMLAESPKSVRVYKAYNAAKALVRQSEAYPVPMHIRNAPTGLMKQLGYGRDYRYEPGYAHPVHQTFLPPELAGTAFLRDEESLVGKTYDEAALKEWEWRKLGGERWPGREDMLRRLAAAEAEGAGGDRKPAGPASS